MRELLGWKIGLGRIRGVQVSLHLFFVLFAGFWLYSFWRFGADPLLPNSLLWYGLGGLGLLALGVLLHELGHAWAAAAVGGECTEIVLAPWGGLAHAELPVQADDHNAAQQELIVALAGPMVNLAWCLATAPMLAALKVPLGQLFHPLSPPMVHGESGMFHGGVFLLALSFWLNWVLFIFNLLPASPLDGARILRASLWKWVGFRSAVLWTSIIGQSAAVMLFLAGLFLRGGDPDGVGLDASFVKVPLVLLAVFVFFSARSELDRLQEPPEEDGSFMGYDFSQGYTSLERTARSTAEPRPGVLQQWMERRRKFKQARQRQQEQEEEQQLDAVLARLHEVGRAGLSASDRRLLDRVSARYRSRNQT